MSNPSKYEVILKWSDGDMGFQDKLSLTKLMWRLFRLRNDYDNYTMKITKL